MRIVYWLRRDLRLSDNPALQWACENATQLCLLYIDDPADAPGQAARWWLNGSLQALSQQLRRQGQQLQILRGNSHQQLLKIVSDSQAQAVCWNRLYEPQITARDHKIKQALLSTGVEVKSFNSTLLLEPWQMSNQQGQAYRVFSPFNKALQRQLDPINYIAAPPRLAALLPLRNAHSLDQAQTGSTPAWSKKFSAHWQVGEHAALDSLDEFVNKALRHYRDKRDFVAEAGTSRLSPHLHFGELGPRQVMAAINAQHSPGGDKYRDELVWREFAHHLLFHFPHSVEQCFQAKFSDFPWRRAADDSERFERWCRGETGIALVDAAMQELWETGWMHNRARMISASFLSKNLGIDWRDGAAWFLDTLLDADLANNTLGWQWVAGCGADAAPYFRIFNPDTQAEKFDPDGHYRQRWLRVPRPNPMCGLQLSRQEALQRYQTFKSRCLE